MTSKMDLGGGYGEGMARGRRQNWAPGRGLGSLESRIIDCIRGLDQSNLDTAHPPGGSGRIENACARLTGRSPSFGDHPSGRQTRKHVWRSRSQVPAALFLSVLGSAWGLLGAFLGVLGRSWGLLGALGTLLGGSWAILGRSSGEI